MRVYKVPIILNEERKLFGGILSIRQLTYLLIGLFANYFIFKGFGVYGILPSLIITVFVLLLTFYKISKYDINFDKYIVLKFKYLLKQKTYLYKK
ncbi:MAG: PrgI family mobile element protein [Thermovenabulum sp.]|uniref:PrgI family mobile element protein n=1 Tax=Thermovenabulum sp. TaxID=3100335 RepID=UPI003C7ECA91